MRVAAALAALNLFAIGNDVDRLAAHADQIDVAAPNWYAVDPAGRVAGGEHAAYMAVAGAEGVEVWPVVNAQLGFRGGWLRERPRFVARQVARIARTYDGVTLDVEEIPPGMRARYSAFVADVARRARRGRAAITVAPRTAAAPPAGSAARRTPGVAVYTVRRTSAPPLNSAAAYDHAALARAADLVLASGYGEHSPASDPGPPTTTAGFADALDYAGSVSKTKVAPVLGGFGIAWPVFGGRGEIVPATDLPPRRGQTMSHGAVVHYATAAALRRRRSAVTAAGFRWVALFSLGREPAGFWR